MRILTIARPLVNRITRLPFRGSVGWVTSRVVVVESEREDRLLLFALPSHGKGPFSVVVETLPPALMTGARVELDLAMARLGSASCAMAGVPVWSPTLAPIPGLVGRQKSQPLKPRLEQSWFFRMVAEGWIDRFTAARLCEGARALLRFCAGEESAEAAVTRLAGLGPGMTPLGDDYLLGACAALHLLGEGERARELSESAAPRTSSLSAAFLYSAGHGSFCEPWHALREALVGRSLPSWRRARERIEAQGATSGLGAWAGFSSLGPGGPGSRRIVKFSEARRAL